MAEKLLTPREAASRLGISYPTIKQWLYRDRLKGMRTPGGHYRIPESEVQAILRSSSSGKKRSRTTAQTMISGRNQLVGRIEEIRVDGLLAQVKLSLGDQRINAIITAEAVREMKLAVGQKAAALIKSTEVMIVKAS
jgi:molybdopterin-binding protein